MVDLVEFDAGEPFANTPFAVLENISRTVGDLREDRAKGRVTLRARAGSNPRE